jgi:hypothetical protein
VDEAGVTPDLPLGDMNGSYTVDSLDIEPFVMALTDPDGYALQYPDIDLLEVGDINGDGEFNTLDIEPFVALLIQ